MNRGSKFKITGVEKKMLKGGITFWDVKAVML